MIEGGESTVITNDNGTVDYSIGENYFDANAGFKNVDEGDYTLTDTSPAIGRASNLISYNNRDYIYPDHDINGLSRPNPSGTVADLGAYESSRGIDPNYSGPVWYVDGPANLPYGNGGPGAPYSTIMRVYL